VESLRNDFLFLRHGETDWNLKNQFQGHNEVPLNEVGRSQAVDAAPVLAGLGIERVFCSSLLRARETAALLLEKLPSPPELKFLADLAECNSEENGRVIYSYLGRNKIPSFSEARLDPTETPESFLARVDRGLNEVLRSAGLPLIVAHGGTYWAICLLLKVKPSDIPNARPIRFVRQDTQWRQEVLWG
jgi:broad specificity phosphatase PhoE